MTSAPFSGEPETAAAETSPDPPHNSAPSSQGWRDEAWAVFVGALDSALRSHYEIVEFTDDPDCVFRIGRTQAGRPVRLSDSTEIREGETIGTLHFWNEQLPSFRRSGPDMRWAVEMRRRVHLSFAALARFVEDDADWRTIRAFRGDAALSSRIGQRQLLRVVHSYGLEPVEGPYSFLRYLHDLGECVNAWCLARVHNPAAASRQRFFRRYRELWISRAVLIAQHGIRLSSGDLAASIGDGLSQCRRS